MPDQFEKQLFRELCWMKAGFRKGVVAPVRLVEFLRTAVRRLGIKPIPVFFRIRGIECVALIDDHHVAGEFASSLFYEEGMVEPHASEVLGDICGYPECCVEAFVRDGCFGEAHTRYKVQSRNKKVVPRSTWYEDSEGFYWAFGFITHVPCSPGCEATREILQRHKELCDKCAHRLCEE